MKLGIGVKIFALSLSLLAITIVLSVFGVLQSRQIQHALVLEAERDIPLQHSVLQLTEHALQRRLAFETWTADLLSHETFNDHPAEDYRKYNQLLAEDFQKVRQLLATDPTDARRLEEVRIRTALDQIEKRQQTVATMQARAIQALQQNRPEAFRELMLLLGPIQDGLQAERDVISEQINGLAAKATLDSERLHQQHMWTAAIATGAASLFGLLMAWSMTRRITHPVQLLVEGVEAAESGDLTREVPVSSSDEIGTLTRSFNSMIGELRSKEQLRNTFGKYVDPKIVESVILNPSMAERDGGRRIMTIGFGDLVGFSHLAEELTPAALVRVLNRHFELMATAIRDHDGVLDKLIGDAVMAFWGPPFCSSSDHALLACKAALAQLALLDTLRSELPEITGLRKRPPHIDLRIGLAAGEVVVGNIGSENTRSYTAIGDTVNLASRLESLNRQYGTRILINRDVYTLAGSAIETRELDWIAVKGKSESATVYELLGLAGSVSAEQLAVRDAYETALQSYRHADWAAAQDQIQHCLRLNPFDRPAQVLLQRVNELMTVPPPSNWDAVLYLTEK